MPALPCRHCGHFTSVLNSGFPLCPACHQTVRICAVCHGCVSSVNMVAVEDQDRNRQLVCYSCADNLPTCHNGHAYLGTHCSRCDIAPQFSKNPSRRKVGFELEFIHRRPLPNLGGLGAIHHDGSVHADRRGGTPREFASIPAVGDRAFSLADAICSGLHVARAYVNSTCGYHLHLDMHGSSPNQRENIRAWWDALEPVFFAMVPEKRRTCHSFAKSASAVPSSNRWHDRYCALNLAAFSEHGTFEVRLHQGTVDASKVKQWMAFQLHFFDKFISVP